MCWKDLYFNEALGRACKSNGCTNLFMILAVSLSVFFLMVAIALFQSVYCVCWSLHLLSLTELHQNESSETCFASLVLGNIRVHFAPLLYHHFSYEGSLANLWTLGRSWRTWWGPMQTRGGHANLTPHRNWVQVLTTTPLLYPTLLQTCLLLISAETSGGTFYFFVRFQSVS